MQKQMRFENTVRNGSLCVKNKKKKRENPKIIIYWNLNKRYVIQCNEFASVTTNGGRVSVITSSFSFIFCSNVFMVNIHVIYCQRSRD